MTRKCSFCHKAAESVEFLIAADAISAICPECVKACRVAIRKIRQDRTMYKRSWKGLAERFQKGVVR